jgi:hypothetical protein
MSEMARIMGFSGFGAQEDTPEDERRKQAELLARRQRDTGAVSHGASGGTRKARAAGGDHGGEAAGAVEDDDEDEDSDGADEASAPDDGVLGMPVTHEIELNHGEHPVIALSVDPAGWYIRARVLMLGSQTLGS